MGKITIAFSFFVLISCAGNNKEKYFTGELEYSYTYESSILDADSLTRTRPSKGHFRYDEYDYQGRFTGPDTLTYYYSGKLNKCIAETGKQQNYSCEDYGVATDSVLSYKLSNTTEKILGYSCKILHMQKKNSWVRYYVSNQLKIAPATYQQHKSYNWDFYGEKAEGGLILRSEHHFKNFIMKGEETSVSRQPGNFSALEIDKTRIAQVCSAKN